LNVLQALIRQKTAKLIAFDAAALATEVGNVLSVNMVLLGALIQTGTVPLQIENVKEAIMNKTSKTFVESNLKAFELGFSVAKELG
jgi:indolepyruvate ferredoxin oxidoreductase beta subunit